MVKTNRVVPVEAAPPPPEWRSGRDGGDLLGYHMEQFARPGILTKGLIQVLRGAGVTSVADLFRRDHPTIERLDRHQLVAARRAVPQSRDSGRTQPK